MATDSTTTAISNAATAADPLAGKPTGQSSSLSPWAGPYVTEMLGKGWALSDMPYTAYQGQLTAGQAPLQQEAFQGLAGLTVPGQFGQATQATQGAMTGLQGAQGSTFTAPGYLSST